ncbi:MAG: hypothetical protein ACM3II_03095 [Rhodospirillaceae bacterium]
MSTGTSRQHPKISTVAVSLLWVPAVVSVVVAGYLMLRTPPGDRVPSSAQPTTAVALRAPTPEPPKATDAPSAQPDAAITAHELLDPVGAGHDVAR